MDMTTSSRTATPPPVRRLADALCTGAAERSQSSAGTRELVRPVVREIARAGHPHERLDG
jgi:hypothetical protein